MSVKGSSEHLCLTGSGTTIVNITMLHTKERNKEKSSAHVSTTKHHVCSVVNCHNKYYVSWCHGLWNVAHVYPTIHITYLSDHMGVIYALCNICTHRCFVLFKAEDRLASFLFKYFLPETRARVALSSARGVLKRRSCINAPNTFSK